MHWFSIGVLAGIVSLLFLPFAVAKWCLISLLLVSLLLLLILFHRKSIRNWLLVVTIGFLFGFAYSYFYTLYLHQQQLPSSLEAKTIIITGQIVDPPQSQALGTSFIVAVDHINHEPRKLLAKLSWYQQPPVLEAGDRWQLAVRLKKPHGMQNPGGFDYEQHLFAERVSATGYVVVKASNQLLTRKNTSQVINRIRATIATRMHDLFVNNPLIGIPIALSVGIKDSITPAQWQVFRATGTSHLMAISGLHIALVAGLLFWLFSSCWRCFPRLINYMPVPYAGAIGALFGALVYSALAGFALPTQRALIMISVFMANFLTKRHVLSVHSLCLALLFVLLFDPLAPLSAGFWLSFAAVGLIFYGVGGRLAATSLWWKWGRVQWVVTLGLIPLSLVLFQQASVISFIANLVAIPWFSFLIVPLCLLAAVISLISLPISGLILKLALWLMQPIWWLLEFLAQLPIAVWHESINSPWLLASALVGVLLLLIPRGLPGRGFAVIWFLPLFLYKPATPNPGEFWLTVLDVGQGLATVVQTQQHVLVYDTGPKFSPDFDTGQAVVMPFLRHERIKQLTMLMISHADNDHIGGAQSLLATYPAKFVLASLPKRFNRFYYQPCIAGQHWRWDGVSFQVLFPPNGQAYADNDSSCVLKVSNARFSVLLTGDIQRKAEQWLVQHAAQQLKTTVLVVPHHGSSTSSTSAFLAAVKPQYAVIAAGYLNRYRLPNQKVLARYRQLGSQIMNTATTGALFFHMGLDSMTWQAYRAQQRQWWRIVNRPSG